MHAHTYRAEHNAKCGARRCHLSVNFVQVTQDAVRVTLLRPLTRGALVQLMVIIIDRYQIRNPIRVKKRSEQGVILTK